MNNKGKSVAFSFGEGACEEVARAKKEGFELHLVTVKDILDKKRFGNILKEVL